MDEIKLELLQYSYWEHHKRAKDLALILSIEHPTRKEIEKELNKIQLKIQKLKKSQL